MAGKRSLAEPKNNGEPQARTVNSPAKAQTEVGIPTLFDKRDVASRAKCCVRNVNYWMQRGELPFIRLSARMVRFIASDVEAFLESRRIGGGSK